MNCPLQVKPCFWYSVFVKNTQTQDCIGEGMHKNEQHRQLSYNTYYKVLTVTVDSQTLKWLNSCHGCKCTNP